MYKKDLYIYRINNHLCVNCGEKTDTGKTRCLRCAQIACAKERLRREEKIAMYGDDYRRAKNEYMKRWREENPDKVAVYKSRKQEYNKRYNRGYSL